jgi:recombination protein RecR
MYPKSLQNLIDCFRMLPGVGEKTAERYALLITESDQSDVENFAQALIDVKTKLKRCSICGNLSEEEKCPICSDSERNQKQIFVVQSAKDIMAMERTNEYKGVYHVLNGLISPAKGVMPEDLNIDSLIDRAKDASEVIIATSATLDGETTSLYLSKLLNDKYPELLVTRIAHGLPSGGLLDYADDLTLTHALENRRKV